MIKVYTKPDCPQCKMTIMFLIRHHVRFLNINVSENPQYAQSLRDKGYRSVPIVVTECEEWSGFCPERLKAVVSRQREVLR
ncbi:glutaredoxin domain-containing protein [Limosilactobacillus mucosae]|uniref:glutaredoxin domain-containing protein n=1 Tax=Limosilactobacillus mucosae TaxID=97478 RepID=UPI0022E981D6|nr:glutaredoxin domain-containing protein [Limosilactobacillus mucosae]